MKIVATVYKTIAMKKEVFASTLKGAHEMIADMEENDFDHVEVLEQQIDLQNEEEKK